MKTALTNEGKARFFAQYFGQEIANISDARNKIVVQKVSCSNIAIIENLQLTPLSLIIDEDAIEVAKIENICKGGWDMEQAVTYLKKTEFKNIYFHAFQYLQSKGYALDYYCPIAKRIVTVEEQVEAGWITLKTE